MIAKKTIMIIEDNPLNMKLTAELLRIGGFDLIKAIDGKSAFEMLRQTTPDLIILDLQLPDMDGIEIMKKIKSDEKTKAIKVVAVTASVMKETEEQVAKAGFDGYIAKPINTREFVKQIKGILGGMEYVEKKDS